ncbi:MAG: glycosyltransferase family 4 protein [Patescibacteria group bacterium]|jgi:glycosyltransferase involved in cell wall biosynthesis
MRIGIDARFYGPSGKGLGRYVQEVVDRVIAINIKEQENKKTTQTEIEFLVFLSPDNFADYHCPSPLVKKVLWRVPWYSWQEQLILPWLIWRARLDLIHFPHFNVPILTPTKFIVTIHDLILTYFPSPRASTLSPIKYYFKNLAYRLVIKTAIRRARVIIAVSEFTKQDLIKKFSAPAEKIKVTHEGVADLDKDGTKFFQQSAAENLAIFKLLNKPFFLYVGSAYPHKNLETLLEIFKLFLAAEPQAQLALVGKSDYFYQRLSRQAESLGLWKKGAENNPVVFLGQVSDAQLASLYQAARVFIFPSLYEGFGLPPLEAMAYQCPVLSSDQGSLPEVLGEAAVYFNPSNQEESVKKMLAIFHNEAERQELQKRGLKQVAKYDWQRCAMDTWQIYLSVIHE